MIRGTKGSRKVTLTEEGMILRKRAEEILDLVKKTEKEITIADDITVGDIYIGAGETDAIRLIAKTAKNYNNPIPASIIIYQAEILNLSQNVWKKD